MDMTKFVRPYLNVPELEALGGEYEGVVAAVGETEIRNRYTGKRSMEPMIEFHDGNRLILNKGFLRKCIGWFGRDSQNWLGHRLRVFLQRVESVDRATGETRERVQRGLLCEDAHAKASVIPRREQAPAVVISEPGEEDTDDASGSGKDDESFVSEEEIFGGQRRTR